jgi:preprotein translocase subunit SecY
VSIFGLVVTPYVNSCILVHVFATFYASFRALRSQGTSGWLQFNQYIRVDALFPAIFQGYGIAVGLKRVPSLVPEPDLLFRFAAVVSLVPGTMFLIWLEQIFARGIADRIWLLLVAGYVADLPASVDHLIKATYSGLPAKVVQTSADTVTPDLKGGKH